MSYQIILKTDCESPLFKNGGVSECGRVRVSAVTANPAGSPVSLYRVEAHTAAEMQDFIDELYATCIVEHTPIDYFPPIVSRSVWITDLHVVSLLVRASGICGTLLTLGGTAIITGERDAVECTFAWYKKFRKELEADDNVS